MANENNNSYTPNPNARIVDCRGHRTSARDSGVTMPQAPAAAPSFNRRPVTTTFPTEPNSVKRTPIAPQPAPSSEAEKRVPAPSEKKTEVNPAGTPQKMLSGKHKKPAKKTGFFQKINIRKLLALPEDDYGEDDDDGDDDDDEAYECFKRRTFIEACFISLSMMLVLFSIIIGIAVWFF